MSTAGPSTRGRGRRRSRSRRLVALAMVAAVLAGLGWGTWQVLGPVRDKGYLGGPVVVPEQYRSIIKKAAKRCAAVPVRVLAAQIAAESGWDPAAESSSGAQGIAQFMPAVWEQYGVDGNQDGVASVWDPADAIHSAAELNCLNRRLVKDVPGDRITNLLAAYNAGYGSVLKYDGVPPFPETQAYVSRILESAKTIVL